MILTFIFALMTAAAALAVLWPLRNSRKAGRAGSDVEVYRDQLDEIERDHAAGRIGKSEAEAARVEVSRRLIAAVDSNQDGAFVADGGSTIRRRRMVAAVALLLLPVGAGSVYYSLGSPGIPTLPLAQRLDDNSSEQASIDRLVAQVEAYLERNPEIGRGWEVLAPIYARSGRYDDAAKAWRNALRLLGENAEREAYLGEALVASANGIVTTEAKSAFDRARAIDANSVSARFYLGLAAEQDGRREEAAKIWRDILASAPADAYWVGFVRDALARVEGKPVVGTVGPSAQDVAAAAKLAPEQQSAMIQNMVDRLAERLKTESSDFDGWLGLVRSYKVLGDLDKARDATETARRAFAGEPEKLRQLNEAINGLGL